MAIYIAILITAPLVLMSLMIIMNVTGMWVGLSMNFILLIMLGVIILANIIFLVFLQFKQPGA